MKTPDILEEYTEFFYEWGTHAIEECFVGSRYQLTIKSLEQSIESLEHFERYLKVEYNGIVSDGGGGGYVREKKFQEYKRYEMLRKTAYIVRGGSPSIRASLTQDPTNAQLYRDWVNSLDNDGSSNSRSRSNDDDDDDNDKEW